MLSVTLDPLRPEDLKSVMGQFCSGVVVATAIHDGEPVGFTCQAFASLSLAPPLVVLAAARTSTTFPRLRVAGTFAVNVLSDLQEGLARAFARSGGPKFDGVSWTEGKAGAPVLAGVVAWAECRIVEEYDAGDHWLVVARVLHIGHGDDAGPLVFHRGRFTGIGVR